MPRFQSLTPSHVCAAALAVVLAAIGAAGCGSLTGPGDPERSIVGSYRGSWSFGIYDADTIARGDDPPGARLHGSISCPADFRVTAQDDKSIKGDFALLPPGPFSSCVSQQPGFCSVDRIAAFCRPVSGTLTGEAFSTGAPDPDTILFMFRMRIPGMSARESLSHFIGCTVVALHEDVFSGGVAHDADANAFMDATVECGGRSGLGRADVAVSLRAERVAGQ
jgi:hypothetical protein